jgi:hypothetical protein
MAATKMMTTWQRTNGATTAADGAKKFRARNAVAREENAAKIDPAREEEKVQENFLPSD